MVPGPKLVRDLRQCCLLEQMSHAVPLSVSLKADAVAPCRLTFGYLAVAGAVEDPRSPADNALFFETSESTLGRVTFEGLDAVRASRGEVAPYDDGHDFSSWVYTIRDSTWLAERHGYEWNNDETPLLESHQHYLFRFHDWPLDGQMKVERPRPPRDETVTP